jgi:ATP synthase protein I
VAIHEEGVVSEQESERLKDRDLKERLDRLSGALERKQSEDDAYKRRDDLVAGSAGETGKAMALGFRIISELVAGVVVGALLGWQIDEWSGMRPLFLIVFLMLGTAAGFWNMIKLGLGKTSEPGKKTPGADRKI